MEIVPILKGCNGEAFVNSRYAAKQLQVEYEVFEHAFSLIWDDIPVPEYVSSSDLVAMWPLAYSKGIELSRMSGFLDSLTRYMSPRSEATFTWLKNYAFFEICNMIAASTTEDAIANRWFSKNHMDAIPGSRLVPVKARSGKRPDFLVELDGVVYPVECKRDGFGSPAVKQLLGYMELWEVGKGFAVAPRKTVDLPRGIVFIQCPR